MRNQSFSFPERNWSSEGVRHSLQVAQLVSSQDENPGLPDFFCTRSPLRASTHLPLFKGSAHKRVLFRSSVLDAVLVQMLRYDGARQTTPNMLSRLWSWHELQKQRGETDPRGSRNQGWLLWGEICDGLSMMGRRQISIIWRESPDASQPQDYPEQRQVGGNAHEAYGGSSSAAELLGQRRRGWKRGSHHIPEVPNLWKGGHACHGNLGVVYSWTRVDMTWVPQCWREMSLWGFPEPTCRYVCSPSQGLPVGQLGWMILAMILLASSQW